MRNSAILLLVFGLAACGGDDGDAAEPTSAASDDSPTPTASSTGDEADDGGRGDIADPQPPGQAFVSVDGQEFTMQEPGGLACTIADDAITFSFRIGDNEVTIGAGANLYETGWLGNISVIVPNPSGEDGVVTYFPDLAAHGDLLVTDGNSAAYSGPMQKLPPNDGSNPPPVDVGDGIISITCP